MKEVEVTIDGEKYLIDVDKCKEQGLLKEYKWYPKDFYDLYYMKDDSTELSNEEESKAYLSLRKLICLRNWWWKNMCDGWNPDWEGTMDKFIIITAGNKISTVFTGSSKNHILAFPTEETGRKFLNAYMELIESAKMFL